VDRIGQDSLIRAQPGTGRNQRGHRQLVQVFAERAGGGHQQPFELVDRRGPGLIAPLRTARMPRIASTMPSRRLSRGGGHPGQGPRGGGRSVDRVGLAALPAGGPVWPVDLHDVDSAVQQDPGQAGAVAAGAFHPDGVQASVAAQQGEQPPVVTTISGELPVAQQPSPLVDDGLCDL
jgi:hypothetical protein